MLENGAEGTRVAQSAPLDADSIPWWRINAGSRARIVEFEFEFEWSGVRRCANKVAIVLLAVKPFAILHAVFQQSNTPCGLC